MSNTNENKNIWSVVFPVSAAFAVLSIAALLLVVFGPMISKPEPTEPHQPAQPLDYEIMETYEELVTTQLSAAREAAYDVEKVFWIKNDAAVAPKPNPECFGQADDPSTLQWLLEDAADVLDGQETVFRTDVEIMPGSKITYYLDDTIFVVVWQEIFDNFVYTMAEVKVMHPSQFRRHLANNEYDSDYIHPVSRMAGMVNAVMASSADYYRGRNHGIIVYQGEVKRTKYSELVDSCFIDRNGDLILVPANELNGDEAAQAFVDEHNIDFSIAFGPILVDNGERCEPDNYYLGEVNDKYPRAALCQKDKLHYVIVAANGKDCYWERPTIHTFAKNVATLGCQKAYALDGGQTGTISMMGKAQNPVQGQERWITDMIYFATAIPSPEEIPEPTEP